MNDRYSVAAGFVHIRELTAGAENQGAQNDGVHLVRRTADGRLCIKKSLKPPTGGDIEFVRFCHQNEIDVIKAVKDARSPYINRYIFHEERNVRGLPTIDLYVGYCDLGTLDGLIDRYQRRGELIPEEFMWHVLDSTARGLAYLHFGINSMVGAGAQEDWDYILHNDIKSGNLFLRTHHGHIFPTIVVGDFGCAYSRNQLRYMQRHGNWWSIVGDNGTRVYYPPERSDPREVNQRVNRGERHVAVEGITPAADVWALGCIMLYMAGLWRQNTRIVSQSQVNVLRDAQYSTMLKWTVNQTLKLDVRQRIQSKGLVAQCREKFAAAVTEGVCRSFRRSDPLPAWSLPRPDPAVSAAGPGQHVQPGAVAGPGPARQPPAVAGPSRQPSAVVVNDRNAQRAPTRPPPRHQGVARPPRLATIAEQSSQSTVSSAGVGRVAPSNSRVNSHSAGHRQPNAQLATVPEVRWTITVTTTQGASRWIQPKADAVRLTRMFAL